MSEFKRLFLGMEVVAPWPETLPRGRLLLEEDRHLTFAFLGDVDWSCFQKLLPAIPVPPFQIGLAACFDRECFLPPHSPRVVAYHLHCLEQESFLFQYQNALVSWLTHHGMQMKDSPFLPHVTVARRPFVMDDWKAAFQVLPCFIRNLTLYESLPFSRYAVCWQMPLLSPFDPIEHTADLAFLVRGQSWAEFDLHAWLALSFHEPSLIEEFTPMESNSLGQVIRNLNARISLVDAKRGSPFKAVSYHGQVHNGEWEMIVDV